MSKEYDYTGYTFAREKTGRKIKKLDRLTKMTMAAQAAGMSYGKYMALVHPPGSGGKVDQEDE